MSEETDPAPASPKKGKKAAAGKAKKSKQVPSHPKISVMVNKAISDLKERGGSSLQAIKKYVASHYKVDVEKLSPFIKKYLKSAVASGQLVQTKGKGATGSFRLSAGGKEPAAVKSVGRPKATPSKASPKAKKTPTKKPKAKKPVKVKTPKKAARAPKPKKAKSPAKPKATKKKAAKKGGRR